MSELGYKPCQCPLWPVCRGCCRGQRQAAGCTGGTLPASMDIPAPRPLRCSRQRGQLWPLLPLALHRYAWRLGAVPGAAGRLLHCVAKASLSRGMAVVVHCRCPPGRLLNTCALPTSAAAIDQACCGAAPACCRVRTTTAPSRCHPSTTAQPMCMRGSGATGEHGWGAPPPAVQPAATDLAPSWLSHQTPLVLPRIPCRDEFQREFCGWDECTMPWLEAW